MGQQTSKEELLYQQVSFGNVEGIKRLREDGAGLEWVDREGKTPLMVACMNPDLFDAAKALIELGVNVNAYCGRSHAGTPLHYAANRGLDQTVKLLLSHGANALVMNHEFQTPLDVARAKGHVNVIRIIESHVCIFSGWMRQLHGPGFLEALVPQWVTWKVWAVVVPRTSHDRKNPLKLELAIYPSIEDQKEEEMMREHEGGCRRRRRRRRRRRTTRRGKQAAHPFLIIQLWKASIEEPNFNEPDPSLVINEKSTKKRFKFLSANEGDKEQLEWFYNACRGMCQPRSPSIPTTETTYSPAVTQYAMAFSDPNLAIKEKPPGFSTDSGSEKSDLDGSSNSEDKYGLGDEEPGGQPILNTIKSGSLDQPSSSGGEHNSGETPEVEPGKTAVPCDERELSSSYVTAWIQRNDPSEPQAIECPDDGPILYPTVDMSPIDLSVPTPETGPAAGNLKGEGDASACAICLDAPKQGACVPCGHVVGCMSCLNDVKDKGWGCPVCRAEVKQVLKLYTV